MKLSWVDGKPAPGLSVRDRGLAYGDGLFETIRVRSARPQLLERHLQRLQDGCQRLGLACDLPALSAEILAFSATLGDGVAKLIITRGEGERGYAIPGVSAPRRVLLGSPAPAYPIENAEQGVRLFACATRLAEQPRLAGLKHLNRLEQVLARAEWQDPAFAEGLMRDMSGRVIEGVFSNIFLVRDGRLTTPALHRCGVAGVMRAEIIEQARQLQLAVQVQDIAFEQLLCADELFLCNSLFGIWPVRGLMEHRWSAGPLTRKLQGRLVELSGNS